MSAFNALLRRDVTLAVRDGGATIVALGFYLIVIAVLPLGLGPDLNLLSRIAPGVLWVGLLLSVLRPCHHFNTSGPPVPVRRCMLLDH